MYKQKKIIKYRPSSSMTPKITSYTNLNNSTQQNSLNNNNNYPKKINLFSNQKSKYRQRLFSLLDISEKYLSRGTCLPKQYKRAESAMTNKKPAKLEKKCKNLEDPCEIIENKIKKIDVWLPKGYTKYQLFVKNPKIFQKKINSYSLFNKNKILNDREQKAKQNKTDVFFSNPPTEKECGFNRNKNNNLSKIRTKYYDSDIFNLKNDIVNLKKCSETFLFKNIGDNQYYITKESNSRWQPKNNIPTLYNCSSKEYNIVIPNRLNTSSTKEKIIIEAKNSFNKQKGITEIIDLSKSGCSKPCEEYIKTYSNNINCFKKTNQIGASLYNSFLTYKDICQKPFGLDTKLKSLQ